MYSRLATAVFNRVDDTFLPQRKDNATFKALVMSLERWFLIAETAEETSSITALPTWMSYVSTVLKSPHPSRVGRIVRELLSPLIMAACFSGVGGRIFLILFTVRHFFSRLALTSLAVFSGFSPAICFSFFFALYFSSLLLNSSMFFSRYL